MIRGEIDAAGATEPESLLESYRSLLQDTVDRVGVEAVVEETSLDRATVERAVNGAIGSVTLSDAAKVVATDPERPDGEIIAAEARDILLLGMTTAVLDVETLASALDGAMEPKELQQKLEGRHPISLQEYAAVHYHLREYTE